jgi:hypothetical protein
VLEFRLMKPGWTGATDLCLTAVVIIRIGDKRWFIAKKTVWHALTDNRQRSRLRIQHKRKVCVENLDVTFWTHI